MNLPQFLAEMKRRNIRRLAVAYVAGGLLVVQAAAVLLGVFEVGAWGMKVLLRTLALGKVHALVRRLDRSARYAGPDARSYGWRT
jgi:hypothetical protein